jgi:hypothetical protein
MYNKKIENSEYLEITCPRRVIVVRLVRFLFSLDLDCISILCRQSLNLGILTNF